MRRIPFLAAAGLLALGCATNPSIPVVNRAPVPAVTALGADVLSRVVIFDRVVFDIPKGAVLGEVRRGNLCIAPERLVWQAEPRTFHDGPYHGEFVKLVTAHNFRVPERPTSLFDAPRLTGTEIVVAARIPSAQENRCSALDVWKGNRGIYKGNVRLVVQWEVYSVADRRVVFTLQSEGTAVGDEFKPLGEHNYYVQAFGNAVRVLLSHDAFRALATSPPARTDASDRSHRSTDVYSRPSQSGHDPS